MRAQELGWEGDSQQVEEKESRWYTKHGQTVCRPEVSLPSWNNSMNLSQPQFPHLQTPVQLNESRSDT